MNRIASVLVLLATVLAAFADGSPDCDHHLIGSTPDPGCYNKKVCSYSCTDKTVTVGKDESCPTSPKDDGSKPMSRVSNLSGRYRHYSFDYRIAQPVASAGCSTCGGALAPPSPEGRMPELQIERIWTADTAFPTSFGFEWGWKGDIWMRAHAPGDVPDWIPHQGQGWVVEVSQPTEDPIDAFAAIDPRGDGVFVDADKAAFRDIRFFDALGSPVTSPETAATAVLTEFAGERFVFELFDDPSGKSERAGRILYYADRNDQRLTWAWKYAVADIPLGDAARTKLTIIDHVTDAYGRTARFTYDEAAQHGGSWVVTGIDLPNGNHLGYRYAPMATDFADTIEMLSGVDHPDGSQSRFATRIDPATSCLEWTAVEPNAEADSRHGTALLTNLVWVNPDDPSDVRGQTWGRLRETRNGAGEQTYASIRAEYDRPDGVHVAHSYIFDHHRAFGIEHLFGDTPTAFYARDDVSGDPATWMNADWSGWTKTADYAWIGRGAVGSHRDAHGHVTTYERDPVSNATTRVTYPDGSTETTEYDGRVQPVRIVDRLGRVTTFAYDDRGNRTAKSVAVGTPAEATWYWAYDARGHVTSATDADGNVTTYAYSDAGDLIAITEPGDQPGDAPSTTTFAYDAAGRRIGMTDSSGRLTTYRYDVLDRLVDTTFADGSHETTTFGAPGSGDENLVVATTDRDGHRTIFAYDASGRRTMKVEGADSIGTAHDVHAATTWTYVPGTTLVATEVRVGDETDRRYDARMRLASVSRATNGAHALTETTDYDAADLATITTDAYGRRTLRGYDVNDRPARTVHELVVGGIPGSPDPESLARVTTPNPPYTIDDTVHDAAGEIAVRIDGRAIVTTFAYDAQGRLTAQTVAPGEPETATTQSAYDPQGNVIASFSPRQVLDPSLGSTRMTYGGRNLLASKTEAFGTGIAATTAMTYTPTRKLATTTDALGHRTTYLYCSCCDRLEDIIDPLGYATHIEYDAFGNRTAVTDGNGFTTSMTYDARNRPWTTTNAVGETSVTSYDDDLTDGQGADVLAAGLGFGPGAVGSAVAVANPLGETTVRLMDGLGRVVRIVDPLGHARDMRYDAVTPDGLVETASSDPLGNVTTTDSDAAGHARRTIDAIGALTTRGFDADGNLVSLLDPNQVGQACDFDLRNQRVRCTDTAGALTAWRYDADGDLVAQTDALLATTTSAYDARDRKISTTDRIAATTTFDYDLVGNLVSITDAEGGTTRYDYDARNLLVAETFPSPTGGTRRYAYDGGRRLVQRLDQLGVVTSYAYDSANRLIARGYSSGFGAVDVFAYDHAGRLTGADSGRYQDQVTRAYDPAGRLVTEAIALDGATFPVHYAYDDADRVTAITSPSGAVATRAYSARNELIDVGFAGAPVAHRRYDDGARLVETDLGNGVVEQRTYVPHDNLIDTMDAANPLTGATITAFSYHYDADKRKLDEGDAALPNPAQAFAYDAEGRLTAWNRGATDTQSWNLTPVGDWATTTRAGVTQVRTHTPVHEIKSIDGAPVLSDPKGNLSLQLAPFQVLGWDDENRLVTAAGSGPIGLFAARYRYDALGRRVQKVVNGQTTTWVSAGAQEIVELTGDPTKAPWLEPHVDLSPPVTGVGPKGSLLQQAGTLHIDFRPDAAGAETGWLADTGALFAAHDDQSYGWDRRRIAVDRAYLDQPEWDTFVRMMPATAAGKWSIALPDGSYPVIVVMGDATSRDQTDTITVAGTEIDDPTPAQSGPNGYEQGAFDGYVTQATVVGGRLTIAQVAGKAKDPKLCFVEIGPRDGVIDDATRDRVAQAVATMTEATATKRGKQAVAKERVYGTYVDEPLMMVSGSTKSYFHANHLYSVAALTDASGTPVERYRYDAYGKRTVLDGAGATVRAVSSYGNQVGFTGRYHDDETGLVYQRNRMFSPMLGRFISRDPVEYWSGLLLYGGYFIPNSIDPSGLDGPLVAPVRPMPLPTPTPVVEPPSPWWARWAEAGGELAGRVLGGVALALLPSDLGNDEIPYYPPYIPPPTDTGPDKQPKKDTTPDDGGGSGGGGGGGGGTTTSDPPPPCPKKCKPCNPVDGTLLYQIVPPGIRERGRHRQGGGADAGHVKYRKVNQTPYPDCQCKVNRAFTDDNTQTTRPGSQPDPGGLVVPGGGPEP